MRWVPSKHASGKWRVTIPAKWSGTGKQKDKYFDTRKEAEEFIAATVSEREEHGRQAVTPDERFWINVARQELGDLGRLREVLDHWKRTGSNVVPRPLQDCVEAFLANRRAAGSCRDTLNDIAWRLEQFSGVFGKEPIHSITPGMIESFLESRTLGWDRRNFFKWIRPLFTFAKRNRWLIQNPFDELATPPAPAGKRDIYTPEEFEKLIGVAEFNDRIVCLYVVLAGLAFCRFSELVKRNEDSEVLRWGDILTDRKEIHIREEVAKSTRRKSGNERFPPIHERLDMWLNHLPRLIHPHPRPEDRVIPISETTFRERLKVVHEEAKVPFVDNGLRHSAISYWLAAHPEFGVAQVSSWAGNSEQSCRVHYLRILAKEDGIRWFQAAK